MTTEDIKKYHQNDKIRHAFYKDSVEKYHALHRHYEDTVDMDLITERRPNESPEVQDYRKKIAVPITKQILWKIILYLNIIRKAKDWYIKYEVELPSKVVEEESPDAYYDKNYPVFTSLTNWAFSDLLTNYSLDSNGVVVVMPDVVYEYKENEYKRPIANIYNAPDIYDYRSGEWYLLKGNEAVFFEEGNLTEEGVCFYYIDKTVIKRFEQVNRVGDFRLAYERVNTTGVVPIIHLYGVLQKSNGVNVLSDSRLSPMVPNLDELVREYSDMQAEVVQHIFSWVWMVEQKCKKCNGVGYLPGVDKDGKAIRTECKTCKGDGNVFNSYGKMTIKSEVFNQPTFKSPMGYVEKSVEIVKLQAERCKQHGFDAAAAVNFQHLFQDQSSAASGTSKEWDREAPNNTVHAIAEDIGRIMDFVHKVGNMWRYGFVADSESLKKMQPVINVPDKFDLFNAETILNAISALVNAKADPSIIRAAQADFARKYFSSDPATADAISAQMELDPLAGMSDENLAVLLTTGAIRQEDAFIHHNIRELIATAIKADKKFFSKDYLEKMAVIRVLAMSLMPESESERTRREEEEGEANVSEQGENGLTVSSNDGYLGKLPLAIQQLSLAATRIKESGNPALAKQIMAKLQEVLKTIDPASQVIDTD
jgi:hypothetical protein